MSDFRIFCAMLAGCTLLVSLIDWATGGRLSFEHCVAIGLFSAALNIAWLGREQ